MPAMNVIAAAVILLATLTLVIFRPQRLPVALPAGAGGQHDVSLHANPHNDLHRIIHRGTGQCHGAGAESAGSNLINNTGPSLTITGSPATLIRLNIVKRRGLTITGGQYLRLGVVTTPVIFLVAVGGLWLSLRVFG